MTAYKHINTNAHTQKVRARETERTHPPFGLFVGSLRHRLDNNVATYSRSVCVCPYLMAAPLASLPLSQPPITPYICSQHLYRASELRVCCFNVFFSGKSFLFILCLLFSIVSSLVWPSSCRIFQP